MKIIYIIIFSLTLLYGGYFQLRSITYEKDMLWKDSEIAWLQKKNSELKLEICDYQNQGYVRKYFSESR